MGIRSWDVVKSYEPEFKALGVNYFKLLIYGAIED
jgi:hypothetical protein